MVCVDTGALVALIVNGTGSDADAAWYETATGDLVSAAWCVTEFGSALALKQRTAQLNADQAHAAWARFEGLVANDVRLLPVEAVDFHRAAMRILDAASAIRAADALHLACAERAGARSLVTLDAVMAKNARRVKLKMVARAG